ncbi:unnamed protein product [Caenorhabditis angaria]|uniref:Uncharacterized protein n=1 Tax=Caenorhabditis angaria TaxID=860376 RepID=A0A9P1IR05_9PELO|nr:unnamed protein product [Caenorhabditis angaria]
MPKKKSVSKGGATKAAKRKSKVKPKSKQAQKKSDDKRRQKQRNTRKRKEKARARKKSRTKRTKKSGTKKEKGKNKKGNTNKAGGKDEEEGEDGENSSSTSSDEEIEMKFTGMSVDQMNKVRKHVQELAKEEFLSTLKDLAEGGAEKRKMEELATIEQRMAIFHDQEQPTNPSRGPFRSNRFGAVFLMPFE